MFERLAIVGTGAIGSVIGAYLSRAGRDITLIDTWADHVEAMKANGLHVTAEYGEFTTEGRLRYPVFMTLRDDKPPADCRILDAHGWPSELRHLL